MCEMSWETLVFHSLKYLLKLFEISKEESSNFFFLELSTGMSRALILILIIQGDAVVCHQLDQYAVVSRWIQKAKTNGRRIPTQRIICPYLKNRARKERKNEIKNLSHRMREGLDELD